MKWEVGKGIDTYIGELNMLLSTEDEVCGKAIYKAAGTVADEVRAGIQGLPQRVDGRKRKKGQRTKGVTKEQKQGLLDGFGITHARTDGSFRHVKLGMDGYNAKKTQKYPNGQPNAMIARMVESGSENHQKTPFIGPAVKRTKERAERIMQETIDESIKTIMK